MTQTMIVSSQHASSHQHEDAIVVATPLDAIIRLEAAQRIQTVVLAGSYASNRELAAFLAEQYPSIRIVHDS